MGRHDDIRRIARARGIEVLVHFTPAMNARSILEHGLAGRSFLDAEGVEYWVTDSWRNDGRMDAVSLSISEVNYTMLRAKLLEMAEPWIIVGLDPQILWTHECRFCWSNASSREMVNHRGFTGGSWAFEKMFESIPVSFSDPRCRRKAWEMSDSQTTDNAAEVQVLRPISPELITAIGIQSERHRAAVDELLTQTGRDIPVVLLDKVFEL